VDCDFVTGGGTCGNGFSILRVMDQMRVGPDSAAKIGRQAWESDFIKSSVISRHSKLENETSSVVVPCGLWNLSTTAPFAISAESP